MRSIYGYFETESILLLGASNSFDSLNRQVASSNISLLFLAIHPILVNTYRKSSDLIVGGIRLLSHEGTTQGDPLAMAMYALATVPLSQKLPQMDASKFVMQMMQQLEENFFQSESGGNRSLILVPNMAIIQINQSHR